MKININYKLIIMQLSAVQLFIYLLAHTVLAVAYPGIVFGEGGFNKFSGGQREWGSGGVAP
jgi:hypothetical protein